MRRASVQRSGSFGRLMSCGIAAAVALVTSLSPVAVLAQTPGKAFFAMNVKDATVSAEWYSRTFKVREVSRFDRPTYDQRIMASEHLIIELIQLKPLPPESTGSRLGLTKAGVAVAGIDAEVARWRSEGVRFYGAGGLFYDRALGLHMVLLLDPDGNMVQVYGLSATAPRE